MLCRTRDKELPVLHWGFSGACILAYACSKGLGEIVHLRSLAPTFAVCIWVKHPFCMSWLKGYSYITWAPWRKNPSSVSPTIGALDLFYVYVQYVRSHQCFLHGEPKGLQKPEVDSGGSDQTAQMHRYLSLQFGQKVLFTRWLVWWDHFEMGIWAKYCLIVKILQDISWGRWIAAAVAYWITCHL